MQTKLFSLIGVCMLAPILLISAVLHQHVDTKETIYEWTCETESFDELVISWNGERPKQGEFAFSVRLKIDTVWTEPLSYAVWADSEQKTFKSETINAISYQDTIETKNGVLANGFSLQIVAKNGATLENLWSLHASTKQGSLQAGDWSGDESCMLKVAGRSQLALNHPRNTSLCSPTSTAAVVSFLSKKEVDTADFAAKVWDAGFDIYGNWIFNVAEAASRLGKSYSVYMARFSSFEEIYKNLKKGLPTVVSVRAALSGAIMPYKEGHLIAVIGYDKESDCILCMDPAYLADADTLVCYPRQEFLTACKTRGNIGYFFDMEDQ